MASSAVTGLAVSLYLPIVNDSPVTLNSFSMHGSAIT